MAIGGGYRSKPTSMRITKVPRQAPTTNTQPGRQPGILGNVLGRAGKPLDFSSPVAPSPLTQGPAQSQTFSMNPNSYRTSQNGDFYNIDAGSGQYFGGTVNPGSLPGMEQFRPEMASLEDATYQRGFNRIDPYLQDQQQATSQRLVNSGLPVGSEAYNREMNRFEQSRGDQLENLALSSVGAGRQEHSRLTGLAAALQGQDFGQQLAGRQFDASESGRKFGETLEGTKFNASESARRFMQSLMGGAQNFSQALASNQFNAGEQGRRFGERAFGSQFDASEQARNFRERLQGRQQGFNEGVTQHRQPFMDLAQLLGLSGGVQDPYFQQTVAAGFSAAERSVHAVQARSRATSSPACSAAACRRPLSRSCRRRCQTHSPPSSTRSRAATTRARSRCSPACSGSSSLSAAGATR